MDNLGLYEALFGKCKDCTISIMTLPDKQIRHYPTEQLKKFYEDAAEFGKTTNTYFSVWPRRGDISIFGLSEEQAHKEALQFGIALLTNAKSLEKEDVVERAWSFLQDWVAANRKRFAQESVPCYGTIEPKHVYIISTNLRQAFEDNGFSYAKCIKGFQERGYMDTIVDSEGKRRSQTQKKIQGVNIRAICANLSIANVMPPEDEFLADPKI